MRRRHRRSRGTRRVRQILYEEPSHSHDVDDVDLALLPPDAGNRGGEQNLEGYTFLTSTPIPGYLRTPSRHAARVKAREKLFGADIANTGVATSPPSRVPFPTVATAPAASSFTAIRPTSFDSITPFERKLHAQGYSGCKAGRGTPRVGGAYSTKAPTSSHFAGFEDILEDVEPS